MRNSLRSTVVFALVLSMGATAVAGPWRCHHRTRVSTGGGGVKTGGGGGNGGGAPGQDPNASVSPEVAEAQAQAEFEAEFGERIIAALVAKFGQRLVDDLIGGDGKGAIIDDVGSLLSRPCTPAAGAAWQQDVHRLQSQIDAINAKLGIGPVPEVAAAGGRIDAKLVASELARQQREDAEAALAEFQNRVTKSRIQERERTLEAKEALDKELEAVNERLRKALDGDKPSRASAAEPAPQDAPPPPREGEPAGDDGG